MKKGKNTKNKNSNSNIVNIMVDAYYVRKVVYMYSKCFFSVMRVSVIVVVVIVVKS